MDVHGREKEGLKAAPPTVATGRLLALKGVFSVVVVVDATLGVAISRW